MLVGIMSDSHGRFEVVRRVVSHFDASGVGHIIHCGDVGDERVFDELVGRSLTFVWGNTDWTGDGVLAYLKTVGIAAPNGVPTKVTLGGKRFAVFHGHEAGFGAAQDSLDVEYLLHGHTHQRRDERRGTRRIINPGALHRANPKTAVVLDTETDELRVLMV